MRGWLKYIAPLLAIILVVPLATIYQQNIEALAHAAGVDQVLITGLQAVSNSLLGLVLLVLFLLLVGATAGLWIEHWLRRKTPPKFVQPPLRKVEGRHFHNTDVPLDGHSYKNCEFTNVTFRVGGGPFKLVQNTVRGCMIAPTSLELQRYTELLHEFGYIKHPVLSPTGEVLPNTKFRGGDDDVAKPL